MKDNWYNRCNRCLPRIKDAQSYIKEAAKDLESLEVVKKVYAWGSYARNIKNPNYRVKDIDILLATTAHSEDLIAIDKAIVKENRKVEALENDGFAPSAVELSKKIADIKYPFFDFWAISGDKKLLHWGAIFADKQDSEQFKREAEKFAEKQTGKKINKLSEKNRGNWYKAYKYYYSKQFSDMPSGWYQSSETIDNIMKKVIKV